MSSIITSILGSTVGLLWNKVRDTTAEKLKDRDVTDEKIRKTVIRELDEIKTKLDGLSRKDLLSSSCCLKVGVDLLNAALDKTEEGSLNIAQGGRDETIGMSSDGESDVLNEALTHSMRMLNAVSDKGIESAKKRFEEASTRATLAFCNEALSIEDRIFATKLRVVAEILKNLESPETATIGCLSFLGDLHSLPAIQEMFSVFLNGGFWSFFNQVERAKNVKSVMLINHVLYQFVLKFSRGDSFVLDSTRFPKITLNDRILYPILDWEDVSRVKSWGKNLIQPPNQLIIRGEIPPCRCSVNSRSEIVVGYGKTIKVVARTGKNKVIELPDPKDREVINPEIQALAVDRNNNLYVVARAEGSMYFLYVFDEKYKVKCHSTRMYVLTIIYEMIMIAVNKNKQIIVITSDEMNPFVCVCDNTGKTIETFRRNSHGAWSLCTLDTNEILVPSDDQTHVQRYTEMGESRPTINVPQGHKVLRVGFDQVVRRIVVLSLFIEEQSFYLLCYSEAGELQSSIFFGKQHEDEEDERTFPHFISHPSGPAAVVRMNSITFI